MKKLWNSIWVVVALVVATAFYPTKTLKAQMVGDISYQTFYDELSPYGDWVYDPDYGYVWAPNVGSDFRPYYSNGRWAMTEYGNTWVSNYAWGWAPFHYGRWTYNHYYGWVWIPDTIWGPAWVSWRYGGGNYGWAPLGPGINIHISFGNSYYVPYDWWTFVPCNHIYGGYYYNYWRGASYNNTYINNTVIINNTYNNTYVYGPRRRDVERVTGGRVEVYNIRNNRSAGNTTINGNELNIYRPEVRKANVTEAPRHYVRAEQNRSIRTASPILTGTAAAERNQRELAASPVRNENNRETNRDRMSRNSDRAAIEENHQSAYRHNGSNRRDEEPNRYSDRDRQVRPAGRNDRNATSDYGNAQRNREEEQQQRAQQERAYREQRSQEARAQQQQRAQQEQAYREQRMQEARAQEQRAQQERAYREQQREQRAAQDASIRQQRMYQEQRRYQEAAPQRQMQQERTQPQIRREWRRPEPQRMEMAPRQAPVQRQMTPMNTGERRGADYGGRAREMRR